jgi:acetyl-CoA carboxylase biotin carboxyl carrier protein
VREKDMELMEEEVIQLLKIIEESSFSELQLEVSGLKLVVRKGGCAPLVEHGSIPVVTAPVAVVPGNGPGLIESGQKKERKPIAASQEGLIAIKAPMLGIVYRKPAPNSPPYVEIGSIVKEGDTVCLMEVMKVFTAVNANVRGRVVDILIESNEMVEYDQPLFLVKPDTEAP